MNTITLKLKLYCHKKLEGELWTTCSLWNQTHILFKILVRLLHTILSLLYLMSYFSRAFLWRLFVVLLTPPSNGFCSNSWIVQQNVALTPLFDIITSIILEEVWKSISYNHSFYVCIFYNVCLPDFNFWQCRDIYACIM